MLHRVRDAGVGRGALWALAVVWVLGGTGDLLGQDARTTWLPREKARIGVMLAESCDSENVGVVRCDTPPVVSSVVVGGPADRAGVRAGDVLLGVNGLDVTTDEGRAALLNLESGVPVELVLERDGGRTRLEVVPEVRAARAWVEVRTRLLPGAESADGAPPAGFRVVRVPLVQGRLDEVEVRLDSLRRLGNEFVFFRDDTMGTLRVEVGGPAHALALGDRAKLRYVWENEELARHLAAVRDSSLRSARVHLDSLVRLRGQVTLLRDSSAREVRSRSRTPPELEWSSVVSSDPLTGELRALLLTDLRVAGAEFRHLEGDLADYFEGADEGLLVMRVIDGTPASRLGLREGDVVVEVDGEPCRDVGTLRRAMSDAGPRGSLVLTWVRKGDRQTGRMELN